MWRVYLDNEEDRLIVLTRGIIIIRERRIMLHAHNPRDYRSDIITVRVKNIPLSADDGQIERTLTINHIQVVSLTRERLRVDQKLTNCETGDRLIVCKKFEIPLPKIMKIGKYTARVFHYGQETEDDNDRFLCNKCLQKGHNIRNCPNEWTCRRCNQSGHKMLECPEFLDSLARRKAEETNEKDNGEIISDSAETQQATQYEQEADSDSETEEQTQSQSQSILITNTRTVRQNKTQEDISAKQIGQVKTHQSEKPYVKPVSSNTESQKKSLRKEKHKNSNTDATVKQTDLSSYVTPSNRRKAQGDKRTPPTPQDRDNNKVPKK